MPMKYAVALTILALPAMLAAKASCPMAEAAKQQTTAAFGLGAGWHGSPIITDRIL